MAQITVAATTAIDDTVSHQTEAATLTGDTSNQTTTQNTGNNTTQPDRYQIEGQRPNKLYTEDLGFVPMRKDPRYTFYRHPKKEKFDLKHEDILRAIEEANLLEDLELLQVSRSNKSIEVRFNTETAAQHFVDGEIHINGSSYAFRRNAQRRLRVSIHGVHPNVPDAALEYELLHYFGGVLEIKRDTKQYKTKIYQTGTRTFTVTELYEHIPRSCRIMNRWCLVYYTGQPYTVRKSKEQTEINQNGQSDPDKEESMSTSETETNSQKDLSDGGSDVSFETVEERDVGFSSKRIRDEDSAEPRLKKKREEQKGMSLEMELMVSQLTTMVRELEEHEFRNIVEVLGEDRSDEIDGVIANMVCLAETARDINKVPEEQKPFYDKLRKKREKNISTEAMHDSFVHTGFYKKYLPRMQRLRDERVSQAPP